MKLQGVAVQDCLIIECSALLEPAGREWSVGVVGPGLGRRRFWLKTATEDLKREAFQLCDGRDSSACEEDRVKVSVRKVRKMRWRLSLQPLGPCDSIDPSKWNSYASLPSWF